MWPDRVSNPGPLTYESGALPIALCGPALLTGISLQNTIKLKTTNRNPKTRNGLIKMVRTDKLTGQKWEKAGFVNKIFLFVSKLLERKSHY